MTYLSYLQSLVVYGGMRNQTHTHYFGEIHLFNLYNFNWIEIEVNGINRPPRARHCAAGVKTKIFIFGGINSEGYLDPDVL